MVMFDKFLAYSQCISWGEINNEVFVFDELSGNIYLFREVEREIWKLIKQRNAISSIVSLMQKNYNTDPDKTLRVLAKFRERGLVKEAKL